MGRALLCLLALACAVQACRAEGGIPEMATLPPARALRSVRIRAVGDLMAHDKQLRVARQADGSYDFHPQYALIAEALGNADYTIANLETTIGKYKNQAYSGYPRFNTPESYLDAVKDAGVDFLTLANNHMLDRYFEGMVSTVDYVERRGFDFGGANRTPEERAAAKVVEVNGVRIGFLCYTQSTNGMEGACGAEVKRFGVNYLKDADFESEVRGLREAGAEAVIAIPHWDAEYNLKPAAATVRTARRMVAAGVDVVLGSHPHVVQPVEYVEAEAADGTLRRGLVAYSLGNFLSNMVKPHTDCGIILEFTLQEQQGGGFAAVDLGCVPVFCWRRDSMIQALSSMKYYDDPPKGMAGYRCAEMKASYRWLRGVLDDSIAMLEG